MRHLLLFFTASSALLIADPSPPTEHSLPVVQDKGEQGLPSTFLGLSYDEILGLLKELEIGELEKKCTSRDLDKLNHFLTFLAREGVIPQEVEENRELEIDIEELLHGTQTSFELAFSYYKGNGGSENDMWLKDQWMNAKNFLKDHKRVIVIGAVVFVATAVVVKEIIVSSALKETAGVLIPSSSERKAASANMAPKLKAFIKEQVVIFKKNLIEEEFFHQEGLSFEENIRTLGALFAHNAYYNAEQQMHKDQELFDEVKAVGAENYSVDVLEQEGGYVRAGSYEIDRKFSTSCAPIFASTDRKVDFTALVYKVNAENALEHKSYAQAIHDLGKVITYDPENPESYMLRGIAHFCLGEYKESIADFEEFNSRVEIPQLISFYRFGSAFIREIPKGIASSGKEIFLLISDLLQHPCQTGVQVWDAFNLLSELARDEDWDQLSELLVPEVHRLVKRWDNINSRAKGRVAGYVFGKYGDQVIVSGALHKAAIKGMKGAEKLALIKRSFQQAQQIFILESISGLESGEAVAKVISLNHKTIALGKDLGFTNDEMAQLKSTGILEKTVTCTHDEVQHDPILCASAERFARAESEIREYQQAVLAGRARVKTEEECKQFLEDLGIETLDRPEGIPENYKVEFSTHGAGIKYVDPNNPRTYVMVMPGRLHSLHPSQRFPYIIQKKGGIALDNQGIEVANREIDAYIPAEDFIYNDREYYINKIGRKIYFA
ncbi:MAG: hypothetical protein ACOYK9_03505 [Chlamydiia bacterium]